ncbi:pseudouridine synthase [Idiomarina xiamenensis]|uniref:Pseudouridine synthase n=1 Tax=Idiomarina xiamenensis 10-D-4 TaxID=740709 RepID=K2KJX1_9GAMM|nr:pseudouridine synthase [Idiomarina xiamenensis]EKE86987.1 RNA pseudouridylate synthase-family protein [Idiomarina xiamenensis 10-D-4]
MKPTKIGSNTSHRRRRKAPKSAAERRPANPKLVLLNKPFNVLSQFSGDDPSATLKGYVPFTDVYPAGRLDKDSEGLLLLTNDGRLQARLADPRFKTVKTYWAQVEGIPDQAALTALANGVELNDGLTLPGEAFLMPQPQQLWPRNPPIRSRKNVADSWLCLRIHEGRNRQVRRMTAHVGHPTLRLIRAAVGPFALRTLQPGQWREETPVW